ncbi:MAG TPA: hypothetical protein VL981_04455, partial [Candidatus Methylacidiphilales bacterium]|nr:hypothetical protein [Candidatus Methylacidiphilales bacterium]
VISYGCYLFHAAGLTVVGKCVKIESFGSLAPFHLCTAGFILTTWVAGLMVTIAMAAAGYLLIERPGIRLGNRIIGLWENPHPVISRSTVTRLTTD